MLTPAQKIAAYQYALDYYYKSIFMGNGICTLLWRSLRNTGLYDEYRQYYTEIVFPEFYAQKPDNVSWFWWPLDESGRLIRIDVLTKAIANVKL